MNISDFNFELPERLIGQKAIEPRDSCKLLQLSRKTGKITHHIFKDLVDILGADSVLVLNNTKVFPARLFGIKDTGGKIEILLLKQAGLDSYFCLIRGKVNIEQKLIFDKNFYGLVQDRKEDGQILVKFSLHGPDLIEKIDQLGKTPLPPYIHSQEVESNLRQQYQTVYAKEKGSVAAPTAGLHFTDELLQQLSENGVSVEYITLHVGLGTFKPVSDTQVSTATLHTEEFIIDSGTADRLNQYKKSGKKIIAVGTTTCRVLESQTDVDGKLKSGVGETSIFIQPGYSFKFVNGLITNFHLPQTSLLMLVTALSGSSKSFQDSPVYNAYLEAIKKEYKFFSFGDAMLIL